MSRKKYHFRKYFTVALKIFRRAIIGATGESTARSSKFLMTACFIRTDTKNSSAAPHAFMCAENIELEARFEGGHAGFLRRVERLGKQKGPFSYRLQTV
jgi:hypothetical protein